MDQEEKMQIALARLAGLYHNGDQELDTDPAGYIQRVCDEVWRMRCTLALLGIDSEGGKTEQERIENAMGED